MFKGRNGSILKKNFLDGRKLKILPSLAVVLRPMHDIGKSGWWILIGLIPLVGAIVLLVFMCLDSEEGHNNYGPNPKALGY